jgi:hypothetical protein
VGLEWVRALEMVRQWYLWMVVVRVVGREKG